MKNTVSSSEVRKIDIWKKILKNLKKKEGVKITQPIRNILKDIQNTHLEVTAILLCFKAFWFIEIIWLLMFFIWFR